MTDVNRRLAALEDKLELISQQLSTLVNHQRPFAEMTAELGPLASEVLSTGIDQCEYLEERGYFAFARELKYLVERLVEDYDPRDLRELADHSANVLDTVRALTQAPIMATLRDLAGVFSEGRNPQPLGLLGALRKTRRDKNVQRGLAFALELLAELGRSSARAPRLSRSELPQHASPAGSPSSLAPAPQAPEAASAPDPNVFIEEGVFCRELSEERALALGLRNLSDDQWRLIECVRLEYTQSGSTPNIRKLTHLSGSSTREIYALFPNAPGKTMAFIACVPRPVGCL